MSDDPQAELGAEGPNGGAAPLPPPPPGAPASTRPVVFPPPPAAASTSVAKRGFGMRAVAVAAGVALLGAGLAFAVTQAGSGGASSPEAAVEDLFAALSDEDVLGLLDVLPAGERRAMLSPVEDLSEELQRLGVLDDGFDLGDISGIDLQFDDLELTSDPLADGIAKVRLSGGTASVSVDPDDLPLGDTLLSVIEELNGEPLEIDAFEESSELDPELDALEIVTIEEGGAWKVSLFYSVAEAARASADLPLPDFGAGVQPRGADSPEAAVEAMLRSAVEDLDLEAVLALLPPDEMAALHDYAPLFLADAQEAIDDFDDYSGTVRDVELSAEVDGDAAVVVIDDIDLEVVAGADDARISFDGECLTFEDDYADEPFEQCVDGSNTLGSAGDLGPDLPELPLRDDPPAFGVATVRVDGAWYVSPTRSMLGVLVSGLGALDDDALEVLPDFLDALFEGFFGFDEGFQEGFDEGFELDEGFEEFEEVGEPIDPGEVPDPDLPVPTFEGLVAMLVTDQGFTEAEADCLATSIYAAGFDQAVLAELETGAIPDVAADQVFEAVDDCVDQGGR